MLTVPQWVNGWGIAECIPVHNSLRENVWIFVPSSCVFWPAALVLCTHTYMGLLLCTHTWAHPCSRTPRQHYYKNSSRAYIKYFYLGSMSLWSYAASTPREKLPTCLLLGFKGETGSFFHQVFLGACRLLIPVLAVFMGWDKLGERKKVLSNASFPLLTALAW